MGNGLEVRIAGSHQHMCSNEGEKMQEQIRNLIYYFMQYRRVDDTRQFSKLTHNNDLCPMIKCVHGDSRHNLIASI